MGYNFGEDEHNNNNSIIFLLFALFIAGFLLWFFIFKPNGMIQ